MADPTPATNATLPSSSDPEVVAIAKVNDALTGLEPAVQQRVLEWAAKKFGLVLPSAKEQPSRSDAGQAPTNGEEEGSRAAPVDTFPDFASLYDSANPTTDAEKALVAGYWLQVVQGKPDWGSFSANKELKNLGHGATNITDALNQLIGRRPRLVMQTHKSGKTKQARKKYKLTGEGIKRVRQMVSESGNGG